MVYFCHLVWPQSNLTILTGNDAFCIYSAMYFHGALQRDMKVCSVPQGAQSWRFPFSLYVNNFICLDSPIASSGLLRCEIAHVCKCLWKKDWIERSWTRAERQGVGWDVRRHLNFHSFFFNSREDPWSCFGKPAQIQNASNLSVFVAMVFWTRQEH